MSKKTIKFTSSCLKTLSLVEAEPNASNQHEFHGVAELKSIFGTAKKTISCLFSVRGEGESYSCDVTWYDSRENQAHRSAEYRLYFQSNPVMAQAKENDQVVIGIDAKDALRCELIKM